MPLLYESTDRVVKGIEKKAGKKASLGLSENALLFLGGLVTGFIVLPILLPIAGYQLQKRYGPPPP